MATSVPVLSGLNGKMAHLGTHAIVIGASMGGGWTVISMKNDWKRIFAFDERT